MNARIAGLVVVATVLGGSLASVPMTDVVLATASESLCGASSLCPADPPPDAGDQGTKTIGANGEVLLGKPTVFTKDNIDNFKF